MSILVMHFLPDDGGKQVYLRQIRQRLKPGATYLHVDICFDAGPMPRSASTSADDLAKLVANGAIKLLLMSVGGLLGGQIVRLYAFRNLGNVVGMVRVDPYAEGQ